MNTFSIARLALLATSLTAFVACQKESSVVPAASPTTAAPSKGGAQVLTPAGYLPAANVHFVPKGFHISMLHGRLQRLANHTNRFVEDYGAVTPKPRKAAPAQGWIAYAYWPTTSTPITQLSTVWNVPDAPAHDTDQTIFLFDGLQDGTTPGSYIIQPVLQWGPSAAGGGSYWAVTNWYVVGSQAFYGSLIPVDPGTSLTGVVFRTGFTDSGYNYNSSFAGIDESSSIDVNGIPPGTWAAETLEAYGIGNPDSDYPDDPVYFTNIFVQQEENYPQVTWNTAQAAGDQHVVVVSNDNPGGEVDLDFR